MARVRPGRSTSPHRSRRSRPRSSCTSLTRGHGATRWDPADGFRAEWLVDDLEGFVDGLGLDTFHVAGFSMGAMTALGFAVRHPHRVRTIVVVSITAEREPRAS